MLLRYHNLFQTRKGKGHKQDEYQDNSL